MMSPLRLVLRLSIRRARTVQLHGRVCLLGTLAVLGVLSCATPIVASSPVRSPSPTPPRDRAYSRIEVEVLATLNRARTDPQGMAASLDGLIRYYDGRLFRRPTWPVAVQTTEGVSAVREAVAALRSQRAVGALTLSASLSRAARDHAADQARSGDVGHTGSDGSSVTTRVARYGTWQLSISENIDYSPMVRGSDVIESLLIDDGVADRGHRLNIYDATAKLVGIACGPHSRYTAMCVIVQAGGFTPK